MQPAALRLELAAECGDRLVARGDARLRLLTSRCLRRRRLLRGGEAPLEERIVVADRGDLFAEDGGLSLGATRALERLDDGWVGLLEARVDVV